MYPHLYRSGAFWLQVTNRTLNPVVYPPGQQAYQVQRRTAANMLKRWRLGGVKRQP